MYVCKGPLGGSGSDELVASGVDGPYLGPTDTAVAQQCPHICACISPAHTLQKRELYATIASLEKDIASLKREIRERDETIGDKERRIYDLKKKNQVRGLC